MEEAFGSVGQEAERNILKRRRLASGDRFVWYFRLYFARPSPTSARFS
jgi:hypothetical protein